MHAIKSEPLGAVHRGKMNYIADIGMGCEALMVARNAPRWLQMLVKHGFVPTLV